MGEGTYTKKRNDNIRSVPEGINIDGMISQLPSGLKLGAANTQTCQA